MAEIGLKVEEKQQRHAISALVSSTVLHFRDVQKHIPTESHKLTYAVFEFTNTTYCDDNRVKQTCQLR